MIDISNNLAKTQQFNNFEIYENILFNFECQHFPYYLSVLSQTQYSCKLR